MFVVRECEKDAILTSNPWLNCKYPTFIEAVQYAKDWLGAYNCFQDSDWELNKKMYYYGNIEGDPNGDPGPYITITEE